MTAENMDVTAVIVNYNTKHLLRPCVSALRAGAVDMSLQVIIVDNGSKDGSADFIAAEFSDCEIVVNQVNVGFGRANNQVLPLCKGRYVLLLNTDAFVLPGAIDETVRFLEDRPECALLGVRLVGRDGNLQPSCRYFPTPWNEFLNQTGFARFFPKTPMVDQMDWDHASPRECDWVPGCYYLVRKSVIDRVGLFDPRYFLYYEEVDHCKAVKAAGWKVMFFPYTTVVHIGGESAKSDADITASGRQISALQIESGLLYYRKQHGRLGLWLNVLLSWLADLLLTVKWAIRRRTLRGAGAYWTHAALVWSLLLKTGWAHRPTR